MRIHIARKRRFADLLIAVSLVWALLVAQPPSTSSSNHQPSTSPSSTNQWQLGACVIVGVLIIGGCATVKMVKRCNKILGSTNSPSAKIQKSLDMENWATVFETNDSPNAFEVIWTDPAPMTNGCAFYRAYFP